LPPIRKPEADPYFYHRAALAGWRPPIFADTPQAGWYYTRFVRGGPKVAVKIEIVQDVDETGELINPVTFEAYRDGAPVDVWRVWPMVADAPITEDEYNFMLAKTDYAKRYTPEAPEANPGQKVDRKHIPKLF
jgi:hypothetical protein